MSRSVRRGGSKKERKYPHKPCSKCGMPYPSNILPQHQDRCSGDATIETAKRAAPRTKGAFIWAQWDNTTLHGILEGQMMSSETAFCDEAPEGPMRSWHPAELHELGLNPEIPGKTLRKCLVCIGLTRTMRDDTLRVRREIDNDTDDEIDNYDEVEDEP